MYSTLPFFIALSMLLMIIILVCLILINRRIDKEDLSRMDKLFVQLPFSIYFGWITVATIANATTLLVRLGWDRFGISEPIWTAVIITVGLIIFGATMLKKKDIAYGLVIVWAYTGILIKHVSANGHLHCPITVRNSVSNLQGDGLENAEIKVCP